MNDQSTGLELQDATSPEALLPDHALLPWWAIAVLLAMVVALVLLILLRKRKPAAEDPRKIREDAFREALGALSGINTADPRDAAVQCSLVLRKYLSVAAADPALYETHEEFIARQDALQALTETARAAAESGFSRLAALKYGPEIPGTPAADVIAESRGLLETLQHGFTA
jgi:hypothetical protein